MFASICWQFEGFETPQTPRFQRHKHPHSSQNACFIAILRLYYGFRRGRALLAQTAVNRPLSEKLMPKRDLFKALFLVLVVTNYAQADLTTLFDSSVGNQSPISGEYSFLGNVKWAPGLNSASNHAAGLGPGGASWSAMPSGVGFSTNALFETVGGGGKHPDEFSSTDIEGLITPAVDGLEYSLFNSAFNVWAAAANITNLGQVIDSGAAVGASDLNGGHLGDIRVAAFPFVNDPPGKNTLAHGFGPLTQEQNSSVGTIGGDIHFDTLDTWVDDPNDTMVGFDFFTVALHELGHALGLGHSTVVGSVMEATHAGTRRMLTADDIAGIQALYGAAPAAVPEPSAFLFGCLLVTLGVVTKRR